MRTQRANSSFDRIARRSWSELRRYTIWSVLGGTGMVAGAYYLQMQRMHRPISDDGVMALTIVGGLVLVSCCAALTMTALLKAGRRLPASVHRAADVILGVFGLALAFCAGVYALVGIGARYNALEASALAQRGVTANVRIDGCRFRRGKTPYFEVYFRVRDENGVRQRLFVRLPEDPTARRVYNMVIRYLPANPSVFRRLETEP